MKHSGWFTRFSSATAHLAGRPATFVLACVIVAIWALTGPAAGFSDFWQLTINTGTTIVTFLMVFVIQNTQNRDAIALQVKLDELIRVTKAAHNSLLDLEELSEEELEVFRNHYFELARKARARGLRLNHVEK